MRRNDQAAHLRISGKMRDMQPVGPEAFQAFVTENADHLEQRLVNGTQCYLDTSTGEGWPDNLVASFLVSGPTRRRPTGWRVAAPQPEEPED